MMLGTLVEKDHKARHKAPQQEHEQYSQQTLHLCFFD
jgi:hypothetical protein